MRRSTLSLAAFGIALAIAAAIDEQRDLAQQAVAVALEHALQKRTEQLLTAWVREPTSGVVPRTQDG